MIFGGVTSPDQSGTTSTSFPGSLSEKRETLVAAGHVPPRIWVVTKNSLKGGRLRLPLSILSPQERVKCCHQNKHFFHVAPVCCITVMSQCNTVQTPKKICTVDKILLRNNPPCGFGLSLRSRDQPQPGSLFSRSWGRGERDPGNEVGTTFFALVTKRFSFPRSRF